jgi:hypothetical protein
VAGLNPRKILPYVMEKVIVWPIGLTAVGVIISILSLIYPSSFGISQSSRNIATVLPPIIASAIGLTYFL